MISLLTFLGREDDQLRQTMSANCRAIALAEYSLELQAKRYIELYKKIL
jgi:glycosyltransferase involved in cell wall biosynthesis